MRAPSTKPTRRQPSRRRGVRPQHRALLRYGSCCSPTPAAAREEIEDAFGPHQTSRVVLAADGAPLAWIAASPSWGRVWELHPLLVAVTAQRRGLGRRLVDAIERHAAAAGALTMWVGTSDTTGATSLSNVDLYTDPLRALATIVARAPHSISFWHLDSYRI